MNAQETKNCQNCKKDFIIESEDFEFYEKIKVPAPTWCPECRSQRRWAFRNERSLYRRTCDLCQQSIISMYAPDKPYTVYCPSCWYSDSWDPLDYGIEYDFSRPFLEQFRKLMARVPRLALVQENMVNSEWANYERGAKNCYLCVGGEDSEDCFYATYGVKSKEVVDGFWAVQDERCYEIINCSSCFKTFFSHWCFSCQDTWFSFDCRNCDSIFGCVGLRNKQYHIFNKPYTPEEYREKMKSFSPLAKTRIQKILEEVSILRRSIPTKDFISKSVGCSGNYIAESKKCRECWVANAIEDSKFVFVAAFGKDSYDISSIGWPELVYDCYSGVHMYECKFSSVLLTASYAEYSDNCVNAHYIFGCVGLRKKSYCILNKQYTKEKYEVLREKIIQHMHETPYRDALGRIYRYGEFFPVEFSPFAYNESAAQQYYPLTKEAALNAGFSWRGQETKSYPELLSGENIPDDIRMISDDMAQQTIACVHGGRCQDGCTIAFRVLSSEFQFYRSLELPFPRLCPNCRHAARLKQRNPSRLWHRKCTCAGAKSQNSVYQNTASHFHGYNHCPNEFETSYAPDRPEIVYCEQCYQSEVV